MFWSSALLLGLIQLAASKPLAKRWDDFEVKHAWAEVPRGWELHAPAPSDYTFDMRIGLTQDKFDELVSTLYEVSDPAHSRYVSSYSILSVYNSYTILGTVSTSRRRR